ncbi:MAG TPA: hypothetical protein VKR59_14725 [Terriglobales bacterium]|nr:hypothetical protein [Terriglobales bacterium]
MSLLRWYCSKLKPPSETAKQLWQKTKAKGKKSFVLRIGVLGWGGFMFIAMTAQSLIGHPFQHQTVYYVSEIAINLLIWPLAGYFFGKRMWDFYEMYFGEENRQTPSA